jgi:hypothetical protein
MASTLGRAEHSVETSQASEFEGNIAESKAQQQPKQTVSAPTASTSSLAISASVCGPSFQSLNCW